MAKQYYKNEKWNKICIHFIANITNNRTRESHESTLRCFISFLFLKYQRQVTPNLATKEDIEEFLRQPVSKNRREGLPPSGYTVNAYLSRLKVFYEHCTRVMIDFRGKKVPLMKKGQLPTDDIPRAKTGDVDRDMEESEVRAFLAAINRNTLVGKRDYALFAALLATGRRRMEITLLRRGDIEQSEFDGGRRGWRFHFRGKWRVTKESAEMPQAVVNALIDFHSFAGRDFMTMLPHEPLFPGTNGPNKPNPMPLTHVSVRFRIYARAAGIGDNVVAHSLRWENAYQRFLANGHDLLKVQEEMGWSSIQQCAHYVRRRRRKIAGDPTAAAVSAKFL